MQSTQYQNVERRRLGNPASVGRDVLHPVRIKQSQTIGFGECAKQDEEEEEEDVRTHCIRFGGHEGKGVRRKNAVTDQITYLSKAREENLFSFLHSLLATNFETRMSFSAVTLTEMPHSHSTKSSPIPVRCIQGLKNPPFL